MIQKLTRMNKTAWIEKLENGSGIMRSAPKRFKQKIAEKEAILSVLNTVGDKCPVKVSFPDTAAIIEGIYYGEVDEEISSTKNLLGSLDKNEGTFIILTDYEGVTTNEKL